MIQADCVTFVRTRLGVKVNVFISWSGARSHAVALVLRDWVMSVIQAAKPWISSADIDRGAVWMNDINSRLQESTVGIFCLTQENKAAPWILFEAGAVAKGVPTSRICTLLIDLEPTAITGPLAQFNHTLATKGDMLKLVKTLNHALGDKRLEDGQLLKAFQAHWPSFEQDFAAALKANPENAPAAPIPKTDDVLAEILSTVRGLAKRVNSLELNGSPVELKPNRIFFDTNTNAPNNEAINGLLSALASDEIKRNELAKAIAKHDLLTKYKQNKNRKEQGDR